MCVKTRSDAAALYGMSNSGGPSACLSISSIRNATACFRTNQQRSSTETSITIQAIRNIPMGHTGMLGTPLTCWAARCKDAGSLSGGVQCSTFTRAVLKVMLKSYRMHLYVRSGNPYRLVKHSPGTSSLEEQRPSARHEPALRAGQEGTTEWLPAFNVAHLPTRCLWSTSGM